jgi:hypothetical protein
MSDQQTTSRRTGAPGSARPARARALCLRRLARLGAGRLHGRRGWLDRDGRCGEHRRTAAAMSFLGRALLSNGNERPTPRKRSSPRCSGSTSKGRRRRSTSIPRCTSPPCSLAPVSSRKGSRRFRSSSTRSARTAEGARDRAPALREALAAPERLADVLRVARDDMFHAVSRRAVSGTQRGTNGKVLEILPLAPGAVCGRRRRRRGIATSVSRRWEKTLSREQVMHLRGPSWNTYSGLEMVDQAREAIGLAIATEESQSRFHANGTRPSGILSTEKSLDPGQGQDQEEHRRGLRRPRERLQDHRPRRRLDVDADQRDSGRRPDARRRGTSRWRRSAGSWRVFPQMIGYSDKTRPSPAAEAFFLAHVIHSLGRGSSVSSR